MAFFSAITPKRHILARNRIDGVLRVKSVQGFRKLEEPKKEAE